MSFAEKGRIAQDYLEIQSAILQKRNTVKKNRKRDYTEKSVPNKHTTCVTWNMSDD